MKKNKFYLHADDYGRSKNISEVINILIKKKKINSISVIVNSNQKSIYKKFNKKINIKLHLNLTDFKNKNFTLLSLFFLNFYNSEKKNKIKKQINNQIIKFKKLYNQESVNLDGHEHIHLIPWVLKYIINNSNKYNINKIRIINEKFFLNNILDIFNFNFIKNFFKFFILKFFSYLAIKKIRKTKLNFDNFCGQLYSNMLNSKIIHKMVKKNKNKNKNLEILFHPGFCLSSEKKNFCYKYYNYFSNKKRIDEYNLIQTLEI